MIVFISTDGLRPDALTAAHTPNFHALMARGAYSLRAQSVLPSITLPCHLSAFHSLPPERHGILSNTFTPMARPVPGLAEVLAGAGLRCGFFYSWEPLRDLCRPGSLHVAHFAAYDRDPEVSDARVLAAALPRLRAGDLDFMFLYLGATDEVGHDHGWMSEPYLRQVEHSDALLGRVLEVLPADATLLVHSDHGGRGRNHGGDHPAEITIPWFLLGPKVVAGLELPIPISLLDTAPTLLHAFGLSAPPQWEGRVVTEAFRSAPGADVLA